MPIFLAIRYMYASCSQPIATATANPPNESVKALLTYYVRKNTTLGVGSHVKYSTQLCLMLYLSLDPTPLTIFSVYCSILYVSLMVCTYNNGMHAHSCVSPS